MGSATRDRLAQCYVDAIHDLASKKWEPRGPLAAIIKQFGPCVEEGTGVVKFRYIVRDANGDDRELIDETVGDLFVPDLVDDPDFVRDQAQVFGVSPEEMRRRFLDVGLIDDVEEPGTPTLDDFVSYVRKAGWKESCGELTPVLRVRRHLESLFEAGVFGSGPFPVDSDLSCLLICGVDGASIWAIGVNKGAKSQLAGLYFMAQDKIEDHWFPVENYSS